MPYTSGNRSINYNPLQVEYISEGAYVNVYICESGIMKLYAQGLRKPLDISGNRKIITADAALKQIMECYNGRRLTKYKVLDQFELVYCYTDVGDGVYQMRPVWAFLIKNTNKAGLEYDEYGLIDAFTGELMLPA